MEKIWRKGGGIAAPAYCGKTWIEITINGTFKKITTAKDESGA